jgi:hypothetical protein
VNQTSDMSRSTDASASTCSTAALTRPEWPVIVGPPKNSIFRADGRLLVNQRTHGIPAA